MARRWLLAWVVLLALAAPGSTWGADEASPTRFVIESEFGEESAWTESYLTRVVKVIARWMDAPDVAPPASIQVELKKDPNLGGIAGAAGPTALAFTSNVWPEERYRRWILAHELANLLAHHYGGAGGYPSDWWSNGRSPFPEYVAVLVMAHLGYVEDAAWRKSAHRGKPDHELFWRLHRRYGFDLFAHFFALIRADGVDLGRIGQTWPRADAARSAYTIAYLSLAAEENLAELVRAHGVGNEPSDWRAIHPDKPFEAYEVTPAAVERILAERERLFGSQAEEPDPEARKRYRSGGAFRP